MKAKHVHRIKIKNPLTVGGGFVGFFRCVDCGRTVNFRLLVQRGATAYEKRKYGSPLGWQPLPEQTYWKFEWRKKKNG